MWCATQPAADKVVLAQNIAAVCAPTNNPQRINTQHKKQDLVSHPSGVLVDHKITSTNAFRFKLLTQCCSL